MRGIYKNKTSIKKPSFISYLCNIRNPIMFYFIGGFDRTIVYEILSLILVTRRWVRRKKKYFSYYDFKANFRPVKVEVLRFHYFPL